MKKVPFFSGFFWEVWYTISVSSESYLERAWFFLEESSEKNHATKEELNMSKVMVIGAGTMGSGIAPAARPKSTNLWPN